MSAPETRGNAPQGPKSSPMGAKDGAAFESSRVKSRHLKITDSLPQLAASYSDHPLQLLAYREIYGNIFIPAKLSKLYSWLSKQKSEFENKKLSTERMKKMKGAGLLE